MWFAEQECESRSKPELRVALIGLSHSVTDSAEKGLLDSGLLDLEALERGHVPSAC